APNVTDAGLAHLAALANLRGLRLNGTKVSDAGLVHLKGMKRLGYLELNDTRVTDKGLGHLAGLTKLKWLYVRGTRLSDAGLVWLRDMEGLVGLDLRNRSRVEGDKCTERDRAPRRGWGLAVEWPQDWGRDWTGARPLPGANSGSNFRAESGQINVVDTRVAGD